MFFRDGWFYPGDIGRVTEHGMMVVSGREKNIIDLGGHKISPETVEAALMSYPGVSFAVAFGVPNALGIEEVWAAVTGSAALDPKRCATIAPAGCRPGRRRPGSSRWRISPAWRSAGSIAESFRKWRNPVEILGYWSLSPAGARPVKSTDYLSSVAWRHSRNLRVPVG